MNMLKSAVYLKGSHLENVPETKGPIKELTCSTKRKSCANRFLTSVKMKNLVNPRCREQK